MVGYSLNEDCVFCRIARKEERASYLYEDEGVVAFLDTRPANEGHALVVPRKHYENIFEIPDDEVAHLFKAVKKVAAAIMRAENADGLRIVQNNGSAANQIVFHLHVHVIPEYQGRDLRLPRPRASPEQSELDRVAAKIKKFVRE
jgi:diadenosine tetraphosphate (Ap4A) HIT family hydrolase